MRDWPEFIFLSLIDLIVAIMMIVLLASLMPGGLDKFQGDIFGWLIG